MRNRAREGPYPVPGGAWHTIRASGQFATRDAEPGYQLRVACVLRDFLH
jgi:hypothetical protein